MRPKDRSIETKFLSTLYTTQYKRMWGYAYHLTRDAHKADDTVQTVFEKIIRHVSTLQGLHENQLKAYLKMAIRNTIYNNSYIPKSKPVILPFNELQELAAESNLEEIVLKKLDFEELETAIATLNEREKDCITLFYYVGLSYQQISELLNISPNNIGVILHRAIHKLKRKLARGSTGEPFL